MKVRSPEAAHLSDQQRLFRPGAAIFWSGSKPATSAPAVYELNKEIFLSGGDSGYIIIHTDYARSWNEERDYLYPVPTDDRVLTQGAITQNPGWNDGLNF